jgi:hypothetical protein
MQLNRGRASVTVPAMPPGKAVERARRARRRRAPGQHRARRIAILVLASAAVGVTLLLTAFGSGSPEGRVPTAPAPAQRLLPTGPPRPQVVAVFGSLQIQVPISQTRITALGYHGVDNGALPLEPVGEQANKGVLARLVRRLTGSEAGLRWYQLGGEGPATAVLDVGAAPGTDVYAPVDGVVVGISDYVISGRRLGSRIDIQPSSQPSLVVSLTHLRSDPSLTVGDAVTASSSKIGTVLDFSRVERQALARYTQDAGNHVSLEVHPSATLSVQ